MQLATRRAEAGDDRRARQCGELADARQAEDVQALARLVVDGQQPDRQRRGLCGDHRMTLYALYYERGRDVKPSHAQVRDEGRRAWSAASRGGSIASFVLQHRR